MGGKSAPLPWIRGLMAEFMYAIKPLTLQSVHKTSKVWVSFLAQCMVVHRQCGITYIQMFIHYIGNYGAVVKARIRKKKVISSNLDWCKISFKILKTQLCFWSSKKDGGIFECIHTLHRMENCWLILGHAQESYLAKHSLWQGKFFSVFGGKNLGFCSLYMALHPIPSQHLGKFPLNFVSLYQLS